MAVRPSAKQREPLTVKRIAILLLSASFGGMLGWILAHATAESGAVGPLTLLACFAGAIFVHELGHVIGAMIVRFQVKSFTVGPLMLRRERQGLRLRRSHVTIGGLVTIVPVGVHNLRQRMLVVVAAGPTSSGVFALIAYALEHSLSGMWGSAMLAFAVSSAALVALSLLPMRRFYLSDGAQIWDMLRFPDRANRQCAILAILETAYKGTRPREWESLLITNALAVSDGSGRDVAANLMAYECCMDRRDFGSAEKHLESALNLRHKCPKQVKSGIALDAAFFYAKVRGESALAREWFENCDARCIQDRYALLMVEAAVLLAEGRFDEALRKSTESESALPQAQFPGFATAAQDWLQIISDHARARSLPAPDKTVANFAANTQG